MEVEHLNRRVYSQPHVAILNEEDPIEVHLIQNDGKRIIGDSAHIKQFTPVNSTPNDMQGGSYQNTETYEVEGNGIVQDHREDFNTAASYNVNRMQND